MCRKVALYPIMVKNVKPGAFIHLKNDIDSPIWVRNHYDRSSRTYSLSKYSDSMREIFRRPNSIVYIACYE